MIYAAYKGYIYCSKYRDLEKRIRCVFTMVFVSEKHLAKALVVFTFMCMGVMLFQIATEFVTVDVSTKNNKAAVLKSVGNSLASSGVSTTQVQHMDNINSQTSILKYAKPSNLLNNASVSKTSTAQHAEMRNDPPDQSKPFIPANGRNVPQLKSKNDLLIQTNATSMKSRTAHPLSEDPFASKENSAVPNSSLRQGNGTVANTNLLQPCPKPGENLGKCVVIGYVLKFYLALFSSSCNKSGKIWLVADCHLLR